MDTEEVEEVEGNDGDTFYFREVRVKKVVDVAEDYECEVGRWVILLWTMFILATCTMLPMKEYCSMNIDKSTIRSR